MTIITYDNYKLFIKEQIAQQPKGGYGQMRKLSSYLKIHTTLISQILNGSKNFTTEQACTLAQYFGLTDLETDYLILLVQWERAGTDLLKANIQRQIQQTKFKATKLAHRMPNDITLSEEVKSRFYSDWYYSGVRMLTSISGTQSINAIAERLDLPKHLVVQVIEFLLSAGLIRQDSNGYHLGPTGTHLADDSPFLVNHHRSWRLKNLTRIGKLTADELVYTAPITVSVADATAIRGQLISMLEDISRRVVRSPAEQAYCIGIDFCRF